MAIDLVEEAVEAGAGLTKACKILEIDVRTLQRWKKAIREQQKLSDQRKAAAVNRCPPNKLTEEERALIIETCNRPEYASLPPSQIVPRLADEGTYIASESSFYRVLKSESQVQARGRAQVPKVIARPEGYQAASPNQVWSWDITFLASSIRGAFYRLYLIEDIYSRKVVGWEVHENESSEHAAKLVQKTCLAEGIGDSDLVLHSDNGGPMKGATMLATLQRLGVIPSFSRPSVSDDNPYSESLFRTLKYSPAYPGKPFESIEAARKWVYEFVTWYNNHHRHSGIRYVTPNQRHQGEDIDLLEKRKALYEEAKERNPARWSGETRNWEPVIQVWLNPPKEHQEKVSLKKQAA